MPSKILIVEDDPISQRVVSTMLRKREYDALLAGTAEEALEILEKSLVPLMLVDWQLPGMDGIELCKRVRSDERFAHIYIIFLTARGEKKDLIKALDSGADDFVSKPFDIDELEARIRVGFRVFALEEKLKLEQQLTMNYANQMEKLAQERAEQLVHADRMASLGVLCAGVAHEINNPTSFICGNLQILERFWPVLSNLLTECRPESPSYNACDFILKEMPGVMKGIKSGADRVSRIVSGLQSFSRHEKNQHYASCDINSVIESALELCYNALKYHVTVTKNLAPDLPKVEGDSQQLAQVVVNLLINAADSMEGKEGQLLIQTELTRQYVKIMVADNGHGIPEEVLHKIWAPFFTTKPIGKGTGLGLSISQGIIEDHKGIIRAENREEGGAVFYIYLPTMKDHKP